MTRAALLLAFPALLVLASCAGPDDGDEPGAPAGTVPAESSTQPAGSPAPSEPPTPSMQSTPSITPSRLPLSSIPPPTLAPPTTPPSEPTDTFQRVRVSGVVDATGTGCVSLTSDVGVRWALLGPQTAELEVGAQVTVTGRAAPQASPDCAGAPLRVESLAARR